MRHTLLCLSLIVAAIAVGAEPASAFRSTTGFHLDLPGSTFYDSRNPGSELISGVERALTYGTTRPLGDVTLFGASTESWLYVHDCGTPPDRTQPAANFVEAGQTRVNLVPIDGTCMTMYGDGVVIIRFIGNEDGAGGLNYVAHPEFTDVPVTPVNGVTHVDVTDPQVPAGAEAVALWVSFFAPDQSISAWWPETCDTGTSLSQELTATSGDAAGNLLILPIDANGEVCFDTNGYAAPEDLWVHRYGYLAPGTSPTAEGLPYSGFVSQRMPGYTALSPDRMFDTRDGGTPLTAGSVHRYQFPGLPESATAVAMNITVTQTSAPGYVSAYPCDSKTPEVSNVNFTGPDQTVPNFAIVTLGVDHDVCFFASTGTHLLADLSGYYAFVLGDGLVPQAPARWFDTRNSGAVAAGTVLEMAYPTSGTASALVVNVTVTQPDRPGFVTVYPCDVGRPEASNLNFTTGQTRPNLVTVRLPADGRLCFYSSAQAHLIADVAGSYSVTSDIGFIDFEPWRVFDTREPSGSPKLDALTEYWINVGDPDIEALAWNMTATEPEAPGYATLYPCGGMPPTVSNLNYLPGETVANFAIVRPDEELDVCMISLARTHLIADEAGVFTGPIPWEVYYEGDPGELAPTAEAYTLDAALAARRAASAISSSTSSVWARPTNNAS